MGSPPQRAVEKRSEDGGGGGGSGGHETWEAKREAQSGAYALGLGLLCVLVEPLLPWMVRLMSSFLSFCSSFSSSFSLRGQPSTASSEVMGA